MLLRTFAARRPSASAARRLVPQLLEQSKQDLTLKHTRGFAVHDIPVPSLGDSVTDGTLVEFVKGPGEAVSADDIVAVIETDKVSVDIRSPVAGTITELLVGEDDTVVVGQNLLTLDSDAEATVISSTPSSDETGTAPESETGSGQAPATPVAPPTTPTTPIHQPSPPPTPKARRPLIKFRHGDREAIARTRKELFEDTISAESLPSIAIDADAQFLELPALYARLPISEEEMNAIELGGASDY